MSSWFKLLPMELSTIDESDFVEPAYEQEAKDSPVGEMSDITRRLFTLSLFLEKNARQAGLDARYCADKTERLELRAKSQECMEKAKLIADLMWISIKDEFGLWGKPVGVRAGYKVVIMPEPEDGMPPFFRGFFGGSQ